jgi:hypothetical protein
MTAALSSGAIARTPAALPEERAASGSNRLPGYRPPAGYPGQHACSDAEPVPHHSERVPPALGATAPLRPIGLAILVAQRKRAGSALTKLCCNGSSGVTFGYGVFDVKIENTLQNQTAINAISGNMSFLQISAIQESL